jgi:hypothetical protein
LKIRIIAREHPAAPDCGSTNKHLHGSHAAIDDQFGARNEAALVRSQK